VLRDFTAEAPDQLWLTDITEHPTVEGELHRCAVKDACSKRIVGCSIRARMTSDLAVNALSNARHRPRALTRPARLHGTESTEVRVVRMDGDRRTRRRPRMRGCGYGMTYDPSFVAYSGMAAPGR
jgi:transposase InsO family protein